MLSSTTTTPSQQDLAPRHPVMAPPPSCVPEAYPGNPGRTTGLWIAAIPSDPPLRGPDAFAMLRQVDEGAAMSENSTPRRLPRYQIQLPLLYKLSTPASKFGVGWTRNLSEGGAL